MRILIEVIVPLFVHRINQTVSELNRKLDLVLLCQHLKQTRGVQKPVESHLSYYSVVQSGAYLYPPSE